VSYQTAYMKANYREEFLAASMTLDAGNTDKLAMFAAEARKSGIRVLPPSINASGVDFLAEAPKKGKERGAIRYSLAALRNIGAAAVTTIVEARETAGAFTSLADFAARLNVKAMNKRALETLAAAGAFDGLEPNRALVHANVEALLAQANRLADNEALGTSDLFGGDGGKGPALDLKAAAPWTPVERLKNEFDAVGFFLSGHPLDQYEKALAKLGVRPFSEFEAASERGSTAGRLAGVVVAARERRSQKGNKFAFAMFSDTSGQFEAVVFSDTLAQCRDLLEPGKPVLLTVAAERDGESLKMRVEALEDLDAAAGALEQGLKVVLDPALVAERSSELAGLRTELKQASRRRGGEVRLVLALADQGQEIEIAVPGRYDVSPAAAGRVSTLPGVLEVLEL
jgi:DNA polymerase-3 subunit alpha